MNADLAGLEGDRWSDDEMSRALNACRYFTCLRCQHVITDVQQNALRAAVSCPSCGREKTFGPGVYDPEFKGYTWAEVTRQRAGHARDRAPR